MSTQIVDGRLRDTSELHPAFFDAHARRITVKVETAYYDETGTLTLTHVRCGRIGITMGDRPVWLVMARRNSIGSSDVVDCDTATCKSRIIGVRESASRRHYHEIAPALLGSSVGYHYPATGSDVSA